MPLRWSSGGRFTPATRRAPGVPRTTTRSRPTCCRSSAASSAASSWWPKQSLFKPARSPRFAVRIQSARRCPAWSIRSSLQGDRAAHALDRTHTGDAEPGGRSRREHRARVPCRSSARSDRSPSTASVRDAAQPRIVSLRSYPALPVGRRRHHSRHGSLAGGGGLPPRPRSLYRTVVVCRQSGRRCPGRRLTSTARNTPGPMPRIHHVGIVVRSLRRAIASTATRSAPHQEGDRAEPGRPRGAAARGRARSELLEPIDPNGGVAKFLEARRGLHRSFATDDIVADSNATAFADRPQAPQGPPASASSTQKAHGGPDQYAEPFRKTRGTERGPAP